MTKSVISINNLSFSYGQKVVLDQISLDLLSGYTYALIGKNGSGKTTLIRCILGLLRPYSGSISISNQEVSKLSSKELGKEIAYVPQMLDCHCSYRVDDYLVFGRTPYLNYFSTPKKSDYDIAISIANEYLPNDILKKRVNQISSGEWQLVNITRALIQDTDIIIMDEPAASLDYSNQILFLKAIKSLMKENKTIVFSTHNPNHALSVNCKTVLINNGKIIGHGDAYDIISQETMVQMFGPGVSVQTLSQKKVCAFNI